MRLSNILLPCFVSTEASFVCSFTYLSSRCSVLLASLLPALTGSLLRAGSFLLQSTCSMFVPILILSFVSLAMTGSLQASTSSLSALLSGFPPEFVTVTSGLTSFLLSVGLITTSCCPVFSTSPGSDTFAEIKCWN